jgi:hypothetical protein
VQGLTFVIPATQEMEIRRSRFKARLGKISRRPYLKTQTKSKKDWGHDSSGRALA